MVREVDVTLAGDDARPRDGPNSRARSLGAGDVLVAVTTRDDREAREVSAVESRGKRLALR